MGAGRICARFTAFLLLSAAFLMGLLSTLGPPTTDKFSYVTATFYTPNFSASNAQVEAYLNLGIFGYRVYNPAGQVTYQSSALGYKIDNSKLPPETNANPDPDLNQIMNYKLDGAMFLVVLQVGQTGLTILALLIPNRFFSMVALTFNALALGLAGLNLLISFITFVGAQDRIRMWWTGVSVVSLGTGQWLLLASIMSIVAALPFSWAMVPPPKEKRRQVISTSYKS